MRNDKQEYIDDCKKSAIDLHKRRIDSAQLGFVITDNNPQIYFILTQCVENFDALLNDKINNVYDCLNELNYVR